MPPSTLESVVIRPSSRLLVRELLEKFSEPAKTLAVDVPRSATGQAASGTGLRRRIMAGRTPAAGTTDIVLHSLTAMLALQ